MSYLTDVPALNYDRKTDARPFDTIQEILRCLSLVQSLLKTEMRQFVTLGTDGLKTDDPTTMESF